MKKNLGNIDRIIRIVLALALGALYLSGIVTGTLGLVMVSLGIVFMLTSFIGFCPLYALVGINTCSTKSA